MKNELSRRDFLKIAATGVGAIVIGGLLQSCSKEKNPRCDSGKTVILGSGDYVLTGDIKITYYGSETRFGKNLAEVSFERVDGETGEPIYKGPGRMPWYIEIGEALTYDYDHETLEPTRVIYRCDQNTFAFWNSKDFPPESTSMPRPTNTSLPNPRPTRAPVAVFP